MQCALRCCDCCTHCRPCGTRGTKGFIGIPNFWLWWNPCSTDSGHLTSAFFKHIPNRLWGIFGSIFSTYFVSVPPKSKHSSLNDLILVLAPSNFCNFRQSYTIISWSRAWINLLIWVVRQNQLQEVGHEADLILQVEANPLNRRINNWCRSLF